MKPDQVTSITHSFQQLLPTEDALAALFYARLFALDPTLMPLFGTDMRAQGRKFTDMLRVIVAGLDEQHLLLGSLQEQGRQHRAFGVRAEHYATVGAALLWAIEQMLQQRYTAEVAQAWSALYLLVATTMQEAAAS